MHWVKLNYKTPTLLSFDLTVDLDLPPHTGRTMPLSKERTDLRTNPHEYHEVQIVCVKGTTAKICFKHNEAKVQVPRLKSQSSAVNALLGTKRVRKRLQGQILRVQNDKQKLRVSTILCPPYSHKSETKPVGEHASREPRLLSLTLSQKLPFLPTRTFHFTHPSP